MTQQEAYNLAQENIANRIQILQARMRELEIMMAHAASDCTVPVCTREYIELEYQNKQDYLKSISVWRYRLKMSNRNFEEFAGLYPELDPRQLAFF